MKRQFLLVVVASIFLFMHNPQAVDAAWQPSGGGINDDAWLHDTNFSVCDDGMRISFASRSQTTRTVTLSVSSQETSDDWSPSTHLLTRDIEVGFNETPIEVSYTNIGGTTRFDTNYYILDVELAWDNPLPDGFFSGYIRFNIDHFTADYTVYYLEKTTRGNCPLFLSTVTLLAPANQAQVHIPSPELQWNPLPNAKAYQVYISQSPTPDSWFVPLNDGLADNFTFDWLLPTTYYWQVKASFESGLRISSEVRSFTIAAPPGAAPPRNLYTTMTPPTLTWSPVDWANRYRIQVSRDKTFTQSMLMDEIVFVPQATVNFVLLGQFYWRVTPLSINQTVSNAWSPVQSYAVEYR